MAQVTKADLLKTIEAINEEKLSTRSQLYDEQIKHRQTREVNDQLREEIAQLRRFSEQGTRELGVLEGENNILKKLAFPDEFKENKIKLDKWGNIRTNPCP